MGPPGRNCEVCVRHPHMTRSPALRFTAPMSRTRRSVGKSRSRASTRWRRGFSRPKRPTNGWFSNMTVRSSASPTATHYTTCPPTNGRFRQVSTSAATITAQAAAAHSTQKCCAASPIAATGESSPASPNPTGQQRFSSILRVSGCRPLPARRMETRQLARRRMDATRSARPRRPGWTAWPNHLIAKLIGAHA